MKLWQKISFISIAALLIVVFACGAALLAYAKSSILSLTVAQGTDKHKNLVNAFSNMAGYYVEGNMNEAARKSVVKYCFTCFADETSVLVSDGETVYTQLSIDPGEHVSPPESGSGSSVSHVITTVHGRELLLLCSTVEGRQERYTVYTVEDISGVYTSIARMGWVFAGVSLACVSAGVLLLTLLVRRSLKPLAALGASARRMAGGEYAGRANAASPDEVGALAGDFNLMAEAVEARIAELTATAERQRMFIAGLTHEFKTPMTSVLIHSDTILNANMAKDERERSLLHIHEQIRWLERLTQKLLLLVNLDKEIETEPVPAGELLTAVQASVCEKLSSLGVTLTTASDDSVLLIDIDLMRSALVNLVDNAAKASAPGQEIRLTYENGTLTIADFGCGIPQSELARVTEPFYMIDRSRSKKQGGSGLGLALVKRIAEAHGAVLSIQSEAGRGTIATITFP